jgi:K+-sensing histidine kinase KdpD
LLGVLGISASWGLRQSVFMSVIATLAFNYFFLPPIGTFTIADPQNWIALFAFLVTAVTASELSERARRGRVLPSSAGRNWSAFTPSASCCFRATIRPSC